MILLLSVVGALIGVYFSRNNLVLSIIITSFSVLLVFLRFKKKTIFFIVPLSLSVIQTLLINHINTIFQDDVEEFSGLVIESKENYFLFYSNFQRYYVYEKDNPHEVGDFLLITSKVNEYKAATYESKFNFKDYLIDKGVTKTLSSSNIEVKFEVPLRTKKIRERFLSKYDGEAKYLIDAFLFNNKNYDSSAIQSMDSLNLLFLLSMSGIYLSFLVTGIEGILKRFIKDKYAEIIPLIILAPYLILTFPKIGIIRVIGIRVLSYINKWIFKLKFDRLSIISGFALTLFIIDPFLAFQSSFLIGFGQSISMIFINSATHRFKRRTKAWLMPLIIYTFILPYSSLLNGELHLFNFIFQLVLIPLNEFYISILLVVFYINLKLCFISNLSNVLVFVYSGLSKIDVTIPLGGASLVFTIVYYLLFFYIMFLLESKRIKHLKFGYIPLATLFVISIIPVRSIFVNAIYFINVGQGDSILIQNKNNIVMIDTGGNVDFDIAKECLIPFMHKKQINHIDYLLTTHNDKDHSGGVESLIKNFTVRNYMNNRDFHTVNIGDIFLKNMNHYNASDENDTSLVFNLNFMNKKWLLMGDASANVEQYLIDNGYDIDCDILKAGHHGSKTSSLDEFVRLASPEEAILSVGERNSYGHPNKEVLATLNKYNVKIRRTDIEGTISYISLAY